MDYSKLSLREKVFQTFVLDPRQITVSGLSLEEFFEKYPVGAFLRKSKAHSAQFLKSVLCRRLLSRRRDLRER